MALRIFVTVPIMLALWYWVPDTPIPSAVSAFLNWVNIPPLWFLTGMCASAVVGGGLLVWMERTVLGNSVTYQMSQAVAIMLLVGLLIAAVLEVLNFRETGKISTEILLMAFYLAIAEWIHGMLVYAWEQVQWWRTRELDIRGFSPCMPPEVSLLGKAAAREGYSDLQDLSKTLRTRKGQDEFKQAGAMLVCAYRGRRLVGVGGYDLMQAAQGLVRGRVRWMYVPRRERKKTYGRTIAEAVIQLAARYAHFLTCDGASGPTAAAFAAAMRFQPSHAPDFDFILAPEPEPELEADDSMAHEEMAGLPPTLH